MKVQQHSVVGITYVLREKGSIEITESVTKDNPFYFLIGVGGLLPQFEENMMNLGAGDHFEFFLDAENAYGERDENAVVNIPVDVFTVDGKFAEEMVQVGKTVHMQDQDGYPLTGKVLSRGLDHVRVDFNHPMAGKALHFTGEVLEVREATAEELSHGHVHGEHGHHH